MEETSSIHNTNPSILGQQTSTSAVGTSPNPTTSRAKIRKNKDKQKVCAQCGTSDTPLWRLGPHGPKSMCNACGIRWKRKNSSTNKRKKPPVPSALTIPSAGQATAVSPKATSPTSLSQAFPFDYPEQEQEETGEEGEDLEESEDAMDSPAYSPQSSPFPTSPAAGAQPSVFRHEFPLDQSLQIPTTEQASLLPPTTPPETISEASAAKRMKGADGDAIPTTLERDEGAPLTAVGEHTTRAKTKGADGSKKAKHKTTSPPPLVSGSNGYSPVSTPIPTPRQQSLREQREQREQREYERAQVAEIQRALNHKYWGGINPTQDRSRRRTIVVTPKCDAYYSDYLDSGGSSSDGDGCGTSSGKSKNFLKVASIELEKMKTEMAYEDKLETMKHELYYLRTQMEAKDKKIEELEASESEHLNRERELQDEIEKQKQLIEQLKDQQNKQEPYLLQLSKTATETDTSQTQQTSNNNSSISSSH